MSYNPAVIPIKDVDFDILQQVLVQKIADNAAAWQIPAAEINKLTAKQTPWTTAWNKAKNKYTTTASQRIARDEARAAYEKVLRPFIQRWVFRNENMNEADVERCGLTPRKLTRTAKNKPDKPEEVNAKRGNEREIITNCKKEKSAVTYGAILVEGGMLPSSVKLSDEGQLIFNPKQGVQFTGLYIDLNQQRKKKFKLLHYNTTYYVYYFLINSAGVSPLSDPVSIIC